MKIIDKKAVGISLLVARDGNRGFDRIFNKKIQWIGL